jgi:hypothetical protein
VDLCNAVWHVVLVRARRALLPSRILATGLTPGSSSPRTGSYARSSRPRARRIPAPRTREPSSLRPAANVEHLWIASDPRTSYQHAPRHRSTGDRPTQKMVNLEEQHHMSRLPPPDPFHASINTGEGSVWAAYRGSGSWQSGMLYHGGAMAGDDHEAGSRGEERWDGFEPTSDETDHAGWLVRCAGCGIRRPDPTPDYCQRCGHPHEVDLARAIEKDLSEYA